LFALNQAARSVFADARREECRGTAMQASQIAQKHFDAAMSDARNMSVDPDAVARQLLGLVVHRYLETRPVSDVQSELRFVADNCDPDTDYMFMRP
jgi:hypothetical protein